MDAVERVKNLCKERGIAISRLEKECGFSNGYIRGLREGKFPSDRMKTIADYLNVSVDYLLGEEPHPNESADVLFGIAKDKDVIEMIAKFEKLNSKKKAHVMELIDFLSEE